MSKLVPPHGGKGLVCCLLEGAALEEELKKAAGLKQIEISSRAKGDLITASQCQGTGSDVAGNA